MKNSFVAQNKQLRKQEQGGGKRESREIEKSSEGQGVGVKWQLAARAML